MTFEEIAVLQVLAKLVEEIVRLLKVELFERDMKGLIRTTDKSQCITSGTVNIDENNRTIGWEPGEDVRRFGRAKEGIKALNVANVGKKFLPFLNICDVRMCLPCKVELLWSVYRMSR